jgi:hypothetical protein
MGSIVYQQFEIIKQSDSKMHGPLYLSARTHKVIHDAHVMYHYTLKAMRDQLVIHYAAVSKVVKRSEERKSDKARPDPQVQA